MRKLSKYEKETIINWNEAEDTASIYTFNADLKRRLAEFSQKYPQLCRLERSTTEGSVAYVMDKLRLSIRLVPPYSEERLAAAREYAKQHGFHVENSEHIDAQRVKRNVYWDCYRGFTTPALRENPEQPDFSFEEIERMYYYEHYSDHVDAQNARNEKTRRTERNRTVEVLLKNNKT